MKCGNSLSKYRFIAGIALAAVLVFCVPTQTQAQNAGDIASYNSSGAVGYSNQYIDAAVYLGSDICQKLYTALSSFTPRSGAVLDARGINASSLLTCSSTETPWCSGSTCKNVPATVLLPAGTITIGETWTLPNGAKLIGEGPSKTIIQVASGPSIGTMINMGTSSGTLACPSAGCTGVEVQDLALEGANDIVNGIVNEYSQDFSFVKNVSLNNIDGLGLLVATAAQNSGPYTDISWINSSPQPTTECVAISITTRGLHGLTCNNTSSAGNPNVAVELEASNNLLEDVVVQNFKDGILIGSANSAASDILENIAGGSTNTIEIGSLSKDISILSVASQGATNSILDDVTSTTLTDPHVAMYVLGEPITANGTTAGHTLFSTSLNVPTWAAMSNSGSGAPSGSCVSGSIVTNSAGVLGSTGTYHTMWVCTGGSWTVVSI